MLHPLEKPMSKNWKIEVLSQLPNIIKGLVCALENFEKDLFIKATLRTVFNDIMIKFTAQELTPFFRFILNDEEDRLNYYLYQVRTTTFISIYISTFEIF